MSTKCRQCGEEMNAAEAMISLKWEVCGKCCRENHKRALQGKGVKVRCKTKRE